jgi:aryl-alcohol dehydrogenase-like predicted oxidoreductase
MHVRQLGQAGLEVSAVGYGAMGISMAYGAADADAGTTAIHRAHELGVTLFDTAEMYGWGENERVLGAAIAGFRDDVVLATKFGMMPDATTNSDPQHIRDVVDESLRRLGTDVIDVLYQHRVDPRVPIEDVAGTVGELVAAGKVRYLGLSEAGPDTLRRAHAVHPVSVLQSEYSLFERSAEELFPVLDELGIGLVAYSPLARGFLTGTAKPAADYPDDDVRSHWPRWQPGNFEQNAEAVQRLTRLADAKGVTLTQLSLAWILDQGPHIVPVPGSRNIARVEENVAAVEVVLTDAERHAIREILPQGAHGARYNAGEEPVWE